MTGKAHHRVEKGQPIWKIVKENISEKTEYFVHFFFVLLLLLFFFIIIFFLYLEIKLNIISLNHKLVRRPSLERDRS